MILKDKVAIVTGAGQGIGEGIAKVMAEVGAKVVVSDINEQNTAQVASILGEDVALGVTCDVSNKEQVDSLVARTLERFGRLDILVNNAGIFPFKPFMEITSGDWEKVIDVNLKSILYTSQAAAKHMAEGGKMVNISSIASFVGFEGLTHYCASKGGMNGFVRALALEMAHKKINVNAVAPGAIKTPGVQMADEETVKQAVAVIPWSRMGEPADIANAVVFLSSDMADYITGQVLVVDGGYTLR